MMANEVEQTGGGWKPCSMAPPWYLSRERKVLLIALVGGSARNMATLQSQACVLATTATTITRIFILNGDLVPEAFLFDVFVLMERFLLFPLMCLGL